MIIINRRPLYPSNRVDFYSGRVLQEIGIKEPPVLYGSILEYFGIKLQWITHVDEDEFEKQSGIRIEIPAFLVHRDDKPMIFIREADKHERRRFSLFHECGHLDIPWHEQHGYVCNCSEIEVAKENIDEKEAFEYARCMMFPPSIFYEDIRSLPVSLETIEILAERYRASFTATANNYVSLISMQCAIIYLQLNPEVDSSGCPFKVNYSIISKSPKFHHYWRKGDLIHHNDMLEYCFHYKERASGEIPAAVFGSSKTHSYVTELRPYGDDQICVFLKIPEKQYRIL